MAVYSKKNSNSSKKNLKTVDRQHFDKIRNIFQYREFSLIDTGHNMNLNVN